ncbi:MAG: GlsB/YeaQ/YmgE family stress response membrane protein [Kofleriaceae bacterium]
MIARASTLSRAFSASAGSHDLFVPACGAVGGGTIDAKTGSMEIIWALLIGLVIGAIAKFIMPGKDPGGILITMVIGVVGSIIAHMIGRAAGWYAPNESAGLIASVLGAVILLAGYRVIAHRRV